METLLKANIIVVSSLLTIYVLQVLVNLIKYLLKKRNLKRMHEIDERIAELEAFVEGGKHTHDGMKDLHGTI